MSETLLIGCLIFIIEHRECGEWVPSAKGPSADMVVHLRLYGVNPHECTRRCNHPCDCSVDQWMKENPSDECNIKHELRDQHKMCDPNGLALLKPEKHPLHLCYLCEVYLKGRTAKYWCAGCPISTNTGEGISTCRDDIEYDGNGFYEWYSRVSEETEFTDFVIQRCEEALLNKSGERVKT